MSVQHTSPHTVPEIFEAQYRGWDGVWKPIGSNTSYKLAWRLAMETQVWRFNVSHPGQATGVEVRVVTKEFTGGRR